MLSTRSSRGRPARSLPWLLVVALTTGLPTSRADRVTLDDGRVLTGSFANVSGVATDPFADQKAAESTPVLMCDDGLTRTFVPRRRVQAVDPAPEPATERIGIPQRVASGGRRMAQIGGILEITPFDEWGRRIFSVATPDGREDVVQGITEITPRYTRIQGLITDTSIEMDMRVATSSIPRETLARVIDQHLDPESADQRLRLVRLHLQAERFDDARAALTSVLEDFPDLDYLAEERTRLARLAAEAVLGELTLREQAGQHRLAMQLLEGFPADDADAVVLEEVRERRDAYRQRIERARAVVTNLQDLVARLEDESDRKAAEEVVAEITAGLSFAALGRFATFERLIDGGEIPADRAVAIAINGWLGGAASADDNLKLALSTVRVRTAVRAFLTSADEGRRRQIYETLRQEEAFDAATVARLARAMPPPTDPGEPIQEGLYAFEIAPLEGKPATRCLVQLPPEYDPLQPYPVVVSLHAAWTTPEQQIDWWSGMTAPTGARLGQGARHGVIVIAPAWSRPGQAVYGFGADEHAVVLASLREACRRFSIDTDRVFLSGHSMGADAAWDLALAHPDLWAGLILIAATSDRYVQHYWRNGRDLPLYIVAGELDTARRAANTMDLDRYLRRGFDTTYVEYQGRGHENFSDEILRIMDWMQRRRRQFFPKEIEAVAMRPWDRFFWWTEFEGLPPRTMLLPAQWPPGNGFRPATIEARLTPGNTIAVRSGASRTLVWLSPELIDFTKSVTVTVDGKRVFRGQPTPELWTMLEDLRLRADRQHPFWQKVDTAAE